MSLRDLVDNSMTDKNTTHSYLSLYEKLLSHKKDSALNVLEVGIGDFKNKNGGSIKLWRDYFTKAKIYGLDILGPERVMDELFYDQRVVLYTLVDAYDSEFVRENFLEKEIKFDFMLDDGPHSLQSQMNFIKLYSPLLAEGGILAIEDIQSWDYVDILRDTVPDHLRSFVKVYDLRKRTVGWDDNVVFVIDTNRK